MNSERIHTLGLRDMQKIGEINISLFKDRNRLKYRMNWVGKKRIFGFIKPIDF